ncbi:zinc finger CCCH domain-containing protein 22-like [Solanum pennellii]|uniref:Zinc finger CCCH domain-containing protein 22-like n=1 Tax=Solanum pennellii TaxID=28526 RepID=A0ABM1H4L1_SOLPN|nr:zinc finger CCCH domain-containing protein 22-like [Solanum pennellii]
MGILLMQDHGEKEMIRLAFGPEALVHSVILKARKELGVSSNSPSTPSTPSSPSPFGGSMCFSRQNSSSSANSGRILGGLSLPSPLSITSNNNRYSNVSASWSTSPSFSEFQEVDLVSPSASNISYTAATTTNGMTNSTMNSSAPTFYCNGEVDLIDEFQLQDQLSFLNDGSPTLGPKNPDVYYQQQQDLTSSPSGDSMLFSSGIIGLKKSITYGPVQDVRIPYQQKRMFGFVTFVYPKIVKTILAKGNPHFVCDARVLVKPYKEKGKVLEKFCFNSPDRYCTQLKWVA